MNTQRVIASYVFTVAGTLFITWTVPKYRSKRGANAIMNCKLDNQSHAMPCIHLQLASKLNTIVPECSCCVFYLHEYIVHWKGNVILTKFSSQTIPKVVKMTTFGVVSDDNFIKMSFSFQCISQKLCTLFVLCRVLLYFAASHCYPYAARLNSPSLGHSGDCLNVIAPVPAKKYQRLYKCNKNCEHKTTKQNTTKQWADLNGCTVCQWSNPMCKIETKTQQLHCRNHKHAFLSQPFF